MSVIKATPLEADPQSKQLFLAHITGVTLCFGVTSHCLLSEWMERCGLKIDGPIFWSVLAPPPIRA